MATDVFGRTSPTLQGVFTADLLSVAMSNGLTSALVRSIQLQYGQPVNRFFDLTAGSNFYYVVGRTSGQANFGRVVGPGSVIQNLYTQYGDACNAANNTLQFTFNGSSCGGGQDLVYTCRYCVLTSIGMAVQSEDVVISENAGLMFQSLEVATSNSPIVGGFTAPGLPVA